MAKWEIEIKEVYDNENDETWKHAFIFATKSILSAFKRPTLSFLAGFNGKHYSERGKGSV